MPIKYNNFTAFIESGAKELLYQKFDEPEEVTFYIEAGDEGVFLCFDVYHTYSSQDGYTMSTKRFTPAEFAEFIGEDNE